MVSTGAIPAAGFQRRTDPTVVGGLELNLGTVLSGEHDEHGIIMMETTHHVTGWDRHQKF